MKSKENGISLIALVVTIIILIILAGVTISNIRSDSGIIKETTVASKKKIASEEKEAVQWAAAQAIADDENNKTGAISGDTGKAIIENKLNKYIENSDTKSKKLDYDILGPGDSYNGKVIIADLYIVKFSKTGNTYLIDQAGKVQENVEDDQILNQDGIRMKPANPSVNIDSTMDIEILTNSNSYTVTNQNESDGILEIKKDAKGNVVFKQVGENKAITVTGKKLGRATIVVETSDGKKSINYVTVHQEPVSISLSANSDFLDTSSAIKSLQIKPTIEPSTANYNTEITWTSSDENIAEVDSNGYVTGKRTGTVTITATTKNNKSATYTVRIIATPTAIELDKENLQIDLSTNKTYKFKAVIYPETADTDKGLTWKTSDESRVTVSQEGVVTGIRNGHSIITVQTGNNKKYSCYVTVVTSPTSISLNKTNTMIDLSSSNTTDQLVTTIYPDPNNKEIGANIDTDVVYTVDKPEIAKVGRTDGKIEAVSNGTAVITAETGNKKIATCTVTVVTSPKSLGLDKKEVVLDTNGHETVKLTPKYSPSTVTYNTALTWKSDNSNIARVDGNGNVTAVGNGTTTITATTANGCSATCTVAVETKVKSITANPNSGTVKVGETFSSTIQCSPSNTTEHIICTSSNSNVASASLNYNGGGKYTLIIRGVAIGKATITVKNSNSTVYTQISITVGMHASRSWSDAGVVSSGWKQIGDTVKNPENSVIKSIKGSANIGANSMWSDRYFGLRIVALDSSNNWVEIWSSYSGTFTWNFGANRYHSADISLTPNKVYSALSLQFMYSTNVDSGGTKYSNFSIDIET